ncbi:MAG: IMPACT family protein [Proteus hauseri]|nr:IMPACT family protein [Proteus hauseri]
MKAYLIPAETVEFSEEIKKSRFITFIAHTEGIDVAKAYIQSIKEQFPDARHHCWAFVAGRPDDSQQLGFSDDGEPTGTAGKPILAPLLGSGMGEVTAVVVRYFGGIKLGTGGLVRAYGSGVQQALKLLPTKMKVPQLRFSVACEYSLVSLLEQVVEQYHGKVLSSEYTDKVTFILSLPAVHSGEVEVKLRDISRGSMQLIPLDKNE